MKTCSQAQKTEFLNLAESVLERLETDRLTRVPLLHLAELPPISGVYFAATEQNEILYIGKASDFTDRCKLSTHHKLPIAIERGAVFLYVASVPSLSVWHVEQWLIDTISPVLNESVSRWWIEPEPKAIKPVGRPKRTRATTRKNYVLDSAIADLIVDQADLDGRSEGSQVEYLALIYEAIRRMTPDNEPFTFAAIVVTAGEIKIGLLKAASLEA